MLVLVEGLEEAQERGLEQRRQFVDVAGPRAPSEAESPRAGNHVMGSGFHRHRECTAIQ